MENATPMQEAITVAARSLAVADSREREIEELQAELARVKAAAEVDARIVDELWGRTNGWRNVFDKLAGWGLQPPLINLSAEQKTQILHIIETTL